METKKTLFGIMAAATMLTSCVNDEGNFRAGFGIESPSSNISYYYANNVSDSLIFYGYGNCIRIKHAYGFETLYSHQSKNFVKRGDKVKAGQVIGLTGRTGRATTEHLHFEISFHGRRMNPAVVFDHGSKKLQCSTLTLTKGSGVKSKKNT